MFTNTVAFFCLCAAVGVLVDLDLSEACRSSQTTACPNVSLVNKIKVIPILNPNQLEEECSELSKVLECLTGPAVLGSCTPSDPEYSLKEMYLTMNKVVRYMCDTIKQEYLAGRQCWSSPLISDKMSSCFRRIRRKLQGSQYCSAMKTYSDCVGQNIMTINGCGPTERTIINAMVAISRNGMANTNCDELPIPSFTTTTTPTITTPTTTTIPTTTTTTTTTQKPITATSWARKVVPTRASSNTTGSGTASVGQARGDATRHEVLLTLYMIAVSLSMVFSVNANIFHFK